jgi:hypothetical protein
LGNTRINIEDWKRYEGITTRGQYIDRLSRIQSDGVSPALCVDRCETEPDGKCPHGNPSVLLVAGEEFGF